MLSAGWSRHVVHILGFISACAASCYFPIEFQGEYVMQSTSVGAGAQVQYSQVNITAEAVPIWGHCHRRNGNSVILTDSSGGANCSRCFHIVLRSRNVLQVRTEGLDKCYTNQDAAQARCPDENDRSKEILLYKTKDLGGEDIQRVYCPISGRFTFVYNVNDGSESKTECPDPVSELDTCPSGSGLNLRFRRCSFEDHDVTFQCLGDWQGPHNERYLALLDTRQGAERRPRYRCALYREEAGTGQVLMAFSSDSTCNSNLRSATSGFETLSLSVMPAQGWPSHVETSNCRFPAWAHGYWQHIFVDGNTLTYKDHSSFKTYTVRCLDSDRGPNERIPVFARTQCGEEMYTCAWLKERGQNVLEFQLGLRSSTYPDPSLCSDNNFQSKIWITQGRLERLQESPCPVAGEYTGVIPDAPSLCAKLSSNCRAPEMMYYTVSNCSHPEVYEEREYRCLGQWKENGLTYTYTQRQDVGTYECFVGSIISDNELYIKEAGEHCQRDIDPLHDGMKLVRIGSCFGDRPSPQPTTPSRRPPEPTKPWKPITAPPRGTSGGRQLSVAVILVLSPLLLCVW